MADFTIILPHKRNPHNDDALAVCLDCLARNTRHEYHLLIDAAYDSPLYPRVNAMFAAATTDCCVYWSSDMFAAPDWDVPMLETFSKNTIVVPVLVEPGIMGAHPNNVTKDFGRTPETFRRAEFEAWAATKEFTDNLGWVAPYMMSKYVLMGAYGGLKTDLAPDVSGFSGADQLLFKMWLSDGRAVTKVKSYVYHLQRYSELSEQTKEGRE